MTRISSARVIHLRADARHTEGWRVWVEWWGVRQAYERDFDSEAEAGWWLSLVAATDPTHYELADCGWWPGGVCSHGGASEAEGQKYRGHYR